MTGAAPPGVGTRRRPGPPNVRRRLTAFVGTAVIVLVVIGLGAVVVARSVAQNDALNDAENTTSRLAALVVAPLLTEALGGNAERRDELDRAVQIRLGDGSVSEINVWRRDGTIIYADKPGVVGKRVAEVPDEVLAAIDKGETSSDIGIADESGELPAGTRFVEVYVPFSLPGEQPLAFEAYYPVERVDERSASLTVELVLFALVPLVLLQLVQIPIATSLARRVARQETERAALLARALSASERERRTIAADLHDTVVQDLAGVGYALGALTSVVPPERRGIADSCAGSVRSAVETLRRLMVDIYPPDLSGPGLTNAIDDLAGDLREAGTEVTVSTAPLPPLDPEAAAALYRVARESLTNISKHAAAHRVCVEIGPAGPGDTAEPAVRLRITDDGVGLAPDAMARRTEGHLGLHMLVDRVADLGGRFAVTPGPEGGTVAEAVLPAHAAG